MFSLNQFVSLLNSLASAHEQIRTFGEGDVWEIGASEAVQYPLMWAVPQPSSTAQKLLNMKFSLIFADILDPDKSNEQDVLSDTMQIALDILAQLNNPDYADNFILDPSANLTPFTEKFDDDVAGWKADINIKINFLSDRCAVPSSTVPSISTPLNTPVIVKNSDGSYDVSFDAGSTAIIPDSVIKNSDDSFTRSLPATNSYTIPDSSITDSDGAISSLPATKSFSAKTLQELINSVSVSTIYNDLVTASKLESIIQLLSNTDLENLTTSQLDEITALLTSVQVQLLSDGQLNDLSTSQLNYITGLLGSTQVALLTSTQISELTSTQIQELTSSQIANLTSAQVQELTNTQIGYMSSTQVQELVHSQLANLSTSQLQYILGSVMSNQFLQDNLSVSQRNSVNEIYTLQTGQTTSYATGDDGNLHHGRLADFFTLKTNNIFGNTHRFTDENGNQTYASNYVIDHATGLGWCRTEQTTAVSWSNAISSANGFSLNTTIGTLSNFYLPNMSEFLSIMNMENSNNVTLNYSPFNIAGTSNGRWVSTSISNPNTSAVKISTAVIPQLTTAAKTGTAPYFVVRRHF